MYCLVRDLNTDINTDVGTVQPSVIFLSKKSLLLDSTGLASNWFEKNSSNLIHIKKIFPNQNKKEGYELRIFCLNTRNQDQIPLAQDLNILNYYHIFFNNFTHRIYRLNQTVGRLKREIWQLNYFGQAYCTSWYGAHHNRWLQFKYRFQWK